MEDVKINSLRKIQYGSILISILLVFTYWNTGISLFYYVGGLILILIFLYSKNQRAFSLLFFILPFENMLRMSSGNLSLVSYIILLLSIRLLFIKNLKIHKSIAIITILIAINLMLGSLIHSRIFPIENIRFLVNIIYLSMITSMYKEHIGRSFFDGSKYYIYGSIILLTISIIFAVNNMGIDLITTRLYGIREDPNYIAMIFSTAISLCLINLYYSNINSSFGFMAITFLVLGVILTQSRGGILSLIPNMLFLFIIIFKINKKQSILFIATLFGTSIILRKNIPIKNMINNVINRMNRIGYDGGSNRIEIWGNQLDIYKSDFLQLLFGGKENIGVAHNLFLGGIAKSGILNFALIFLALGLLSYSVTKISPFKGTYFFLLPLTVMGIGYFFLDALLINNFIYIFILSFSMFRPYQNLVR